MSLGYIYILATSKIKRINIHQICKDENVFPYSMVKHAMIRNFSNSEFESIMLLSTVLERDKAEIYRVTSE